MRQLLITSAALCAALVGEPQSKTDGGDRCSFRDAAHSRRFPKSPDPCTPSTLPKCALCGSVADSLDFADTPSEAKALSTDS